MHIWYTYTLYARLWWLIKLIYVSWMLESWMRWPNRFSYILTQDTLMDQLQLTKVRTLQWPTRGDRWQMFLWTFPSSRAIGLLVQETRTECLPDYVAPSLGHIMGWHYGTLSGANDIHQKAKTWNLLFSTGGGPHDFQKTWMRFIWTVVGVRTWRIVMRQNCWSYSNFLVPCCVCGPLFRHCCTRVLFQTTAIKQGMFWSPAVPKGLFTGSFLLGPLLYPAWCRIRAKLFSPLCGRWTWGIPEWRWTVDV